MRILSGILFLMCLSFLAYAEVIQYNGDVYIINDEFSHKSFIGKDLKDNLNLSPGLIIYASNFSQETNDTEDVRKYIFPEDMVGVTFINCNMDNVYIPPDNMIIGGTQRIFKNNPQDNLDWIIDEQKNFIEVL